MYTRTLNRFFGFSGIYPRGHLHPSALPIQVTYHFVQGHLFCIRLQLATGQLNHEPELIDSVVLEQVHGVETQPQQGENVTDLRCLRCPLNFFFSFFPAGLSIANKHHVNLQTYVDPQVDFITWQQASHLNFCQFPIYPKNKHILWKLNCDVDFLKGIDFLWLLGRSSCLVDESPALSRYYPLHNPRTKTPL